MSEIKVALVGIGGYALNFVAGMLDARERADVRLVAVVDPFPAACPRLDELLALGIPVCASLEAMYAEYQPDLVVIASPIQLHCEQTVAALKHGSHVLCEKPLCASLDQIDRMIEARDRAQRQVAIGYQWSFSPTFHALKRDINQGLLGAPIRLSTLVCVLRDERYYHRNRWAGRRFDELNRPVNDSPVNNACAHYLNNMFFVLGGAIDRSAMPHDVTAELFRANAIENYDTAAIHCKTGVDVDIHFFVSHAAPRNWGPLFRYEFENATVSFDADADDGVVATFKDGSTRNYGTPSNGIEKLWMTIDAIRNGKPVCSSIESASAQTRVMTAAQQSEIIPFPPSSLRAKTIDGIRSVVVDGLDDCLLRCYRENKLPRDLGFAWSAPSVAVKSANSINAY
jgi:predicted dehydrogenase